MANDDFNTCGRVLVKHIFFSMLLCPSFQTSLCRLVRSQSYKSAFGLYSRIKSSLAVGISSLGAAGCQLRRFMAPSTRAVSPAPELRQRSHSARSRSRSPTNVRAAIRSREALQTRAKIQRASRSRTSSSSSSLSHTIPIDCPAPMCDVWYVHQHPPNLQYYKAVARASSDFVSHPEDIANLEISKSPEAGSEECVEEQQPKNADLRSQMSAKSQDHDSGQKLRPLVEDLDAEGEDDIEWWKTEYAPQTPVGRTEEITENGLVPKSKTFCAHREEKPKPLHPSLTQCDD